MSRLTNDTLWANCSWPTDYQAAISARKITHSLDGEKRSLLHSTKRSFLELTHDYMALVFWNSGLHICNCDPLPRASNRLTDSSDETFYDAITLSHHQTKTAIRVTKVKLQNMTRIKRGG